MTSKTPSVPEVWFGRPLVPGKAPVKKNLFEEVSHATGTLELVPVFPYLDNGAIVPCLSVSMGGASAQRFQFFHDNVTPEVLLCLAEKQGALKAGQMMVLPNLHGVNNFLKDLQDESAYLVVLITVRMNQQNEQREGFLIRCEQCNELLYQRYQNIKQGPERPYYPEFHALAFYADAVDAFNASDRTCPKCKHVQPPFPVEQMGWRRYAMQVRVANQAREEAERFARQLKGRVAD
jgi:phage FluMu protein Com